MLPVRPGAWRSRFWPRQATTLPGAALLFMTRGRRTQGERSAATQRALVSTARRLFGDHGYFDTPRDLIVDAARATRGALQYHFPTKEQLFVAVYQSEIELIGGRVRLAHASDLAPLAQVRHAAAAFVEATEDPATRQVVLVDGPSIVPGTELSGALDALFHDVWTVGADSPSEAVRLILDGALFNVALRAAQHRGNVSVLARPWTVSLRSRYRADGACSSQARRAKRLRGPTRRSREPSQARARARRSRPQRPHTDC
jgi:AcrR family transcriptional regulator